MAAFVSGVAAGSFVGAKGAQVCRVRTSTKNVPVRTAVRAVAAPLTPNDQNKFVKHRIFGSEVEARRSFPYWFPRAWVKHDFTVLFFISALHLISLAVPFTMSWRNVGLMTIFYIITGMIGITMTYHRLLSHKSFKVPKWLEYFLAYCGVMSGQGDPITWVKDHRHHHKYCDTNEDVHTPKEGFWWSHAGWLVNNAVTDKRKELTDETIATDLEKQGFYRFLKKTYGLHMILQGALMWYFFGFGGFVWAYAFRAVWVYHITWFVNSASHVWGYQSYKTGDISKNNWWVGILAFGEGWHNNHHAFEYSARHGLEWWQYDPTWWTIRFLKFLGLAKNVKLPSEAAKAKLAIENN
mmetsp:Transcript_9048/g.27192  ORF Transcript_9048/g.27192 Transcript_9048/m.27192 type:complete len:352 (-) Transcript_9048:124-1179(-)|eukprot:CAMPEP_0198722612 /NCGR_PEP_ID=MMETSP1475-20131203/274_1 /TAXON_ID= ORGANISM="Unidentified sp., Strain CCMP1999" /NCGR_SAMPLE_ID=MMETSP1475 /ASSEMBLY_ACC=CAM_ASM_001111 /LENGTH=351 /DNA_ID=CAMNT_0044483525 /DNA_START=163 /DNA_END=1218 /DNA_ORIENTATION=-